MGAAFDIIVARIETLDLDAIVNAANSALMPGGGVDGAIRRAAGPELNALLANQGGLAEGEALTTPGFRLKARAIIHTVAPIYFGPEQEDWKIERLGACYVNCIAAARALNAANLAFPALGTGAFGWPKQLGRDIALASVARAQAEAPGPRITFCCFTEEDAALYRAAL